MAIVAVVRIDTRVLLVRALAVLLPLFGVQAGSAQSRVPAPAEIVNRAEMRLRVAASIHPFWTASDHPDALFTINVWIGPNGVPDSMAWPQPELPRSSLGAVIVEQVWRHGRFDAGLHSGWRRWTIRFSNDELQPTAEEKLACPTAEAMEKLLLEFVRWYELRPTDQPNGRALPKQIPLQVEVSRGLDGSPHCESGLAASLTGIAGYRTSSGSLICVEGACPDARGSRHRIDLRQVERRWLPAAWTVRTSDGAWDVYCARGECRAQRWRHIW